MGNLFFTKDTSQNSRILMTAILVMIVIFTYASLCDILPAFGINLPLLPGGAYTQIFSAVILAFLGFAYLRGWKPAVGVFLILFVVVWAVECLSIHTGIPGGFYYYTPKFPGGPMIWDTPTLLGLYYFANFFFIVFFVSSLLVEGVLFTTKSTWWKRALFISFIAALLVIGLDMLADPVAVHVLNYWVWITQSFNGYYGIPLSNYVGYIILMTPLVFLFKYLELKWNAKPLGPVTWGIALLPLYMGLMRYLMLVPIGPPGLYLVGALTILTPLILSLDKLRAGFNSKGTYSQ